MKGGLLKPLLSSANVPSVTLGPGRRAPSVYFWRL